MCVGNDSQILPHQVSAPNSEVTLTRDLCSVKMLNAERFLQMKKEKVFENISI